jgi:hypothetical protein
MQAGASSHNVMRVLCFRLSPPAHRAFIWDYKWHGLAYNYTVKSLQRRALSLWSDNYHHRRQRRSLLP